MNCLHCQKELPANYAEAWCPFCGRDLEPDSSGTAALPAFEANYINWPRFFIVLFVPPVCCFLALAVGIVDLAGIFGVFGSFISGLVCTRMIMGRTNLVGLKRAAAHFGLAMLLCCLSCFLCFVGCMSAATVSKHGL